MLRSTVSLWALRVLVALVLAAAIVAPFYLGRRNVKSSTGGALVVPNTHDMAQHLAVMEQFDKVLRAGTLYPRWLPDVNNGYGLAWTNFYPPGLYYVTSLVNAPVNDWMYTMFIVSILALAASGLSFYIVSRLFYGQLASAVAALLYMAAPYHALDLYWRGAMPEFTGFILVPAIIYFAFKLGSCGKARYLAGLGFFHGIFILTHFPVAYLMTYVLAFYAVSRAAKARDWKIAVRIGSGIAIALLLGSIYWVPAALEASQVAEQFSRLYPYHKSFVTLLPGGDDFTQLINVSFAVLAVTLMLAAWLLYSLGPSGSDVSRVAPERAPAEDRWTHTRQWVVMAIASMFMCTSLSIYVSGLIPKINAISFAWRWLVIATFFTSLVVAAAFDRLSMPGILSRRISLAYGIALTAALGLNIWCTVQNVILPKGSGPILTRPQNLVESGFIPAGAQPPQYMPASALATLDPPSGEVQVVRWDPLHREVRVDARQPAFLKLKTYNFPGWVALLDGQPAQISSDTNGAQVVNLLPGEHSVEIFFVNTPPRTLGGALTGAAFLIVLGLIAVDLNQRRRSFSKGAAQDSKLMEALPAARDTLKDEETSLPLER